MHPKDCSLQRVRGEPAASRDPSNSMSSFGSPLGLLGLEKEIHHALDHMEDSETVY